ncbi:MAG: flagellar hook-basal body complex protein FliE [Desulfobacterales bacterium]
MNEISIHNNMQSLTGTAFSDNDSPAAQATPFGEILTDSMNQVNKLQVLADEKIEELAAGKQTDIHQTMIAVEKAGVSFELLMQIRNKLISAYDQIMRMQV